MPLSFPPPPPPLVASSFLIPDLGTVGVEILGVCCCMDLSEAEAPTSTADLANCPPRYFLFMAARSLFCLDKVSVTERPEDNNTLSLRVDGKGVAAAT